MAGKSVEITHGSGTPVAVDEPTSGEAEGVKLQRVKLMSGIAGSAADVSTEHPLPINDAGGSLTVDSEALGTKAEAEATGEGGIIGILKRLRKLLEGSGSIGIAAGTAEIGKVKVTELPSVALGAGTAEVGKVKVTELPSLILAAGSAAIGKVIVSKIEEALPAGTNRIGKVELEPRTSGGVEVKRVLSAGTTNATSVKASPGQVYGFAIFNTSAAVRYVKLYNKASAPTVGTDTPVMTLMIPKEGGVVESDAMGIVFGTGIALATTKGVADSNTEAVAEDDLIINLYWK